MNNKIYLLLVFFFGVIGMNAQSDYYYYYKGKKIALTLDKNFVHISATDKFNPASVTNLRFKEFRLEEDNASGELEKISKLEFQQEPSDAAYLENVRILKQTTGVKNVSLYFKRTNAPSIGTSSIFYVKLRDSKGYEQLQKVAEENNAKVVAEIPNMPLWYRVALNAGNASNSLEISNAFYETGYFAEVDPAFMFNFKPVCTNDPSFGSLWGLNNSANSAIDINACQAWGITQGSGTKVAIMDQGIYKPHGDLANNISTLSYDAQSGTVPSVFVSGNIHGTHVAGTVGAVKDNNLQVVGVAPQSKLISVSHTLYLNPNFSAQLASGISWAAANGADVINNSWGDQGGAFYGQIYSTILENAIINAMTTGRGGKGTLVVFAAGNYGSSGPVMDYPGNFNDDIITVGAITSTGSRSSFSGYGTKLDVVAPGSNILSTVPNNGTAPLDGTSMASPHVSGLVALILSVNPCLKAKEVRDIIEKTSQKIPGYTYSTTAGRPNGTWNNQLGYGLIDAYAAVVMAQQLYSPTLDLLVKDTPADTGIEPNLVSPYMWASEDIWIRNSNDNGLIHQNPEYSSSTPNYVYVRVKNKSCVASLGNEKVKLYWSKAGTSLAWPNNWNGSYYIGTVLMGNQIGTATVPALQPGQEAIVQFTWTVPNPANYTSINPEPWHFCLLARVEATNDPMTFTETSDLNSNVKNNNNIAWKNITIVDALPNRPVGGVIGVGNPTREPRTYFLEFIADAPANGRPIFEQAEVTIKLDNILYEKWMRGGAQAGGIVNGRERGDKIVRAENAALKNITFEPNELATLNLTFRFLSDEIEQESFIYHIVQRDARTGEIVGGETYNINRTKKGKESSRQLANAGSTKVADKNDVITLSAAQANEEATYNWYDQAGTLIFQGKDMTVSVDMAKKYKLEVIALSDGFKDYAEVEVKLKPSSLGILAPNPAKNKVDITYKLNDASSAYLMVVASYGAGKSSNNYILDLNSQETQIDVSGFKEGLYKVALVCNGKIVDVKTLVKK